MGIFSGLFNQHASIKNRKETERIKKRGENEMKRAWSERTDFEIPKEVQENIQTAKNNAYGKPAIQSYMEEAANQGLSNNLTAVKRYATSSADALAAAAGANNQAAQGMNNAAMAGAEQSSRNMDRVYEANNQMADYKTMAWDMNVNVPFLQRLQWAQGLVGAGYQGRLDANNQYAQGGGETFDSFFGMLNQGASGGASRGTSQGSWRRGTPQ